MALAKPHSSISTAAEGEFSQSCTDEGDDWVVVCTDNTAPLCNSNLANVTSDDSVSSSAFPGTDAVSTQVGYDVDIVGRSGAHSVLSPTLYKVRVSGPDGEKFVWHRYNDFCSLDKHLRSRLATLPAMPEKGVLCKLDDGFGENRQKRLATLLRAMIAADTNVQDPVLRKFLELPVIPAISSVQRRMPGLQSTSEVGQMVLVVDKTDGAVLLEPDSPLHCSVKYSHSCLDAFRTRRTPSCCSSPLASMCSRGPRGASSVCSSPCGSPTHIRRCFSQERWPGASHAASASEDHGFKDTAVLIARDVARVFNGDSRVDVVRLKIAEILRNYARKDPALGYTQGMCFAAAVICLSGDLASAEVRFGELMHSLRRLWLPGFPMVKTGSAALQMLLAERDPDLNDHFRSLALDFKMVVLNAWLSMFGKWLPLSVLIEVGPFLCKEGLAGFLTVTYVVLLHHRLALLELRTLDEVLPFMNNLVTQAPPENVLEMCELALPVMHAHVNFKGT